ncbi:MAG TPA: M1 family metallopeptidase [Geminicoccaceae bacterium]|nr:M1 family metallopeptidase [Geminicoccus sp.]HMU53269.1 M1 family metallopeptidase [Geminicoccaceae bacterium]
MRRAFWLAGVGLLATLASAPARAIDPFFPEFGNNGYDVQDYDLSLAVDPAKNRLDGRAVLTIRALERLTAVALDLHGLDVKGVRTDGAVSSFTHSGGKLRVRLPSPLAKGATFVLAVAYGGNPEALEDPTAPGADILGVGWNDHAGATYVVSEPVGAGTWYPVNDVPTDKATYRVAATVPEPYTAVSNGALESITDLGAERRFVWKTRQPMASYLAILDVADYRLERSWARRALPIRTYTTDKTPSGTIAALRKTPAMLAYFERFAGPYPFGSYGSVMVDDPELYYALETQGMSTFPSAYQIGESTVAHELAHQWFGDAVTVERWEDLWLAEGFATYFEFIWEFKSDRVGLDAAFRDLYDYALENELGPAVVSTPEDIFSDRTYYRGALTLQALRLRVGDDAFFRTLKAFFRNHRYGNATSADFVDTAVRQSGQPAVRGLLNAWLYEQPVPPLGDYYGPSGARTAKAKAALPFATALTRRHPPRLAAAPGN